MRNIEFEATTVRTSKNTGSGRDWFVYSSDNSLNRVPSTAYKFDVDKNKFITVAESADRFFCVCGTTAGDITAFTPKARFRALDYNDKATIVDWCVPDYTAGVAISGITAANTTFSVPKDGILHIVMNAVSGLSVTYVDDIVACALANASVYSGFAVSFMPISRGNHTFRCDIPDQVKSITFYPYKGG